MNSKQKIVNDFRWWQHHRKRYFEKIKDYADGFVSAFAQPDMEHLSKVKIFDTTARDGMQMSRAFVPSETSPETIRENKLFIIEKLAEMGVPTIEAGFAAASEEEQGIIRTAKQLVSRFDAKIVALGRTVRGDIDAIVRSEADVAHIFSSGSAPHTYVKFGKMPDEIIPDIERAVVYANSCGFGEIVVSLEDAVRTDPDHLVKVGKIIRDIAGDKVKYNIPDTVGVADPVHMFALIRFLRENVGIGLQVHCHGDRGLAEMNSISAALAGALDIHVTMHGMGERAGNAALEEVTGFMMTQYGIRMVNMEMLPKVSEFVESRTGIQRKINAPYVGKLAFWHESGVHGSAVNKGDEIGYNRRGGIDGGSVYTAYNPEIIGRKEQVGVGPLSGQTNVIWKMIDSFGITINDKEVATRIITKVKDRSAKMPVSDADLVLITYECARGQEFNGLKISDCKISTCMNNGSEATVETEIDGKAVKGTGHGNGPIDAAIHAIMSAIGREDVKIEDYDSTSIGRGSDAAANCRITVQINGVSMSSSEIHTNTVMAAVKAFEKGYNAICAVAEMKKTS
ncbi:hypothetical protein JXA56_00475 [Candidatus Micrarchaeota archaeon]|nr:hypothetical protein [Candidatus Micrarchaeota archaeon]